MADPACKSTAISPRRRLLEEVLFERSKVVAGLPIDDQDPRPGSPLWVLGAGRLASRAHAGREGALELAVVALAWLEAWDALPAEGGAGGEDDAVR